MGLALAGIALLAVAASPAPVIASVTIGSDLTGALYDPAQPSQCAPIAPPCTNLLGGVHSGNAYAATSPTFGTVTAFNIKTGGAGTVTFRLGVVEKSVAAKGEAVATGPTVKLPGAGTYSFPASVPIAPGQAPGFDSSLQTSSGACFQGGYYFLYNPPLVDGSPPLAAGANSTCELMVNAVVEPEARFSFGSLPLNRVHGTAKLNLTMPGPGRVTISGKGVRKASKSVAEAGNLNLPITPVGSAKTKLDSVGSASFKVSVKFVPTGGSPSVLVKRVKLIKK
jgi:hypothetical protein